MSAEFDKSRAEETIRKLREEIRKLKAKVLELEVDRMESGAALLALFELFIFEDSLTEDEAKVRLADITPATRKLLNFCFTPAEEKAAFENAKEIRSAARAYTQSLRDKARVELGRVLEEYYIKTRRNPRKY